MSRDALLAINAGSSSLKFDLFYLSENIKIPIKKVIRGEISQILSKFPKCEMRNDKDDILCRDIMTISHGMDPYQSAVKHIMEGVKKFHKDAVVAITSHRIVHGGDKFRSAVLIDTMLLSSLREYIPLAPLHQPFGLEIAKFFLEEYSAGKHYACFDTAFHQTMDPIGRIYAIPMEYTKQGVKRYGFHGLSYKYISNKLIDYVDEEMARKKWIIGHLGSGASLCALQEGKSVSTTLGFSVCSGIPMSTRCGDIDIEIVFYWMEQFGLTLEEINNIIYKRSGLLGMSGGLSSDMRELLASNRPEAKLAIDVYTYQIAVNIGKLVASMGGCDGIVFTAGIGAGSWEIRKAVCDRLGWLNVCIDQEKNNRNDVAIHAYGGIPVLVIPTDEEYIMGIEALQAMGKIP